MESEKKSFNPLWFLLIFIVLVGGFYFFTRSPKISPVSQPGTPGALSRTSENIFSNPFGGKKEPTIIKEELKIPATKKITVTGGRTVEPIENKVETPLVPRSKSETVIIPLATFSVKGSYEKGNPVAKQWTSDATLSFIKSLGAITLEGKSSQWQLAFVSSAKPGKAYEIIIQGDAVVSKKEIESTAVGGKLPQNWYDSDEALKRLAELPQFVNTTISQINLFYNPDAKAWRYAVSTSVGTTSLEIK